MMLRLKPYSRKTCLATQKLQYYMIDMQTITARMWGIQPKYAILPLI